jgi:hypothetical protein
MKTLILIGVLLLPINALSQTTPSARRAAEQERINRYRTELGNQQAIRELQQKEQAERERWETERRHRELIEALRHLNTR